MPEYTERDAKSRRKSRVASKINTTSKASCGITSEASDKANTTSEASCSKKTISKASCNNKTTSKASCDVTSEASNTNKRVVLVSEGEGVDSIESPLYSSDSSNSFFRLIALLSRFFQHLFIFPILCYQKAISPWLPAVCRFTPTCSAYAIEAIRTHGVFKGLLLGSWRILRCNPFGGSGYDPVPPRKLRSKKLRKKL